MYIRKTCLKVRLVTVCLLFLFILSLSFIAWLSLPANVEASPLVVVAAGNPGSNAPTDATLTTDIATGSGGVIYVTVKGLWGASHAYSSRILIKSINYGTAWTDITSNLSSMILNTDYVAVAPDDPNVVMVVDKTNFSVCLSTNGGNTWTSLGQPPMTVINDVDINRLVTADYIEPSVGGMGIRYIAVAGVAGGTGAVYYYTLGGVVPSWQNALNTPKWKNVPPSPEAFWAVKFSPYFAADWCMLAVSSKSTQGVQLHVASLNILYWDSYVVDSFPRKLTNASDVTLNRVDIALDPNFFAANPAMQIGFIGASMTNNVSAEIGGVYSINSYTSAGGNYTMAQLLTGAAIESVAWDGTRLVAGTYDSNIVYCSTNTTSPSPTFSITSGSNAPGGEKNTLVAFTCAYVWGSHGHYVLADTDYYIIAATGGSGSGISRSTDGGATFKGILPYSYNLASPILEYPSNNASIIEKKPTFSWQIVPYASSYELQLAANSSFNMPITDTTLSQTSFPLDSNLQVNTTYYWRVRSLCDIISSPWSSTHAFTVIPPPPTTIPPVVTTTTTTTTTPTVTTTTTTTTPATTTTTPPPPETGGFPVAPVAGGVAGGAAAIGGGILVKRWLDKKKYR